MSGKLDGKIALVTGGTAGIGLATAQRFVKEGAYVFVTGRRQTELDQAAKLMSGHLTAVKADTSNLDDLDKLRNLCGIEKMHTNNSLLSPSIRRDLV